jgi:hypothetical protein
MGQPGGGGTYSDGMAFSLGIGLGPFVESVPTSGTVLTPVNILGTDLQGVTSVRFNGVPTLFIPFSKTFIDLPISKFQSNKKGKLSTSFPLLDSFGQ